VLLPLEITNRRCSRGTCVCRMFIVRIVHIYYVSKFWLFVLHPVVHMINADEADCI